MYTLKISDNATVHVKQNDSIEPLDSDSTLPITLYGKDFREYGQQFQNNLYYILENFCGDTAPKHPIIGMLWYDNRNDMLKLYTGKEKPDGPWMQVAFEDASSGITTTTTVLSTTTTTEAITTTTLLPTTSTTSAAPTITTSTTLPPNVVSINYNTIKFGITWGGSVDLDSVIVGYDSAGLCKMYKTVVVGPTFGTFDGITYNGDIRTGGVEESYDITLNSVTYDTLVLGILEYTPNSFPSMTSLQTRIVDTASNTDIANFTLSTITKDVSNTVNTTCIVGVFTRTPSGWTFKSQQKLINSKSDKKDSFNLDDTLASLGLT